MSNRAPQERLKEAGITAWRLTILAVATTLVLVLYLGLAYLVYTGRMEAGPIILFTGVILGYILRAVRDWR